mgnify:CR=1 FL=1
MEKLPFATRISQQGCGLVKSLLQKNAADRPNANEIPKLFEVIDEIQQLKCLPATDKKRKSVEQIMTKVQARMRGYLTRIEQQ